MKKYSILLSAILICLAPALYAAGSAGAEQGIITVPLPLDAYQDGHLESLWQVLYSRIQLNPFNLIATLIFFFGIIHAFMAGSIMKISHRIKHEHEQKRNNDPSLPEISFRAESLHFFGEVEAVFGIWIIPLVILFIYMYDWHTFVQYVTHVNYTEPMFVVVIMALASAKPVIYYAELAIRKLAGLFGGGIGANWFFILFLTPLLGSFITEPAAMTIAALLLADNFYRYNPKPMLAYATLGLLFVNISIGGTLTHFAAPPVLIVASKWQWDTLFMLEHFGWKAFMTVLFCAFFYGLIFRKDILNMSANQEYLQSKTKKNDNHTRIPLWIFIVHLLFMAWVIVNAHYPVLFIGGFLFFLAFNVATYGHRQAISFKGPLLVGFFLAGLVTHGGLQSWWIAPTLSRLSELPLFLGATVLTAFNDNAAITYLGTLVPDFSDAMKYALVSGAVTGGGLTVLANAPNPAGQAILAKYFKNNISPLGLFLGALIPTVITALFFIFLPDINP